MEGREKKSGTGPKDKWVKMPRELTLSNELNPYQYRVLAILLDRDNLYQGTKGKTWFYCYLGWITDHSGMGETKVKQTLKELEKMGFIRITRNKDTRLANRFHINWDYIKAYKRPLTQKELEGMEDPDALEEEQIAQGGQLETPEVEVEVQEETTPVETAAIPFNCDEFDVDMSVEEEYRRQHYPDPPTQSSVASNRVQTSTLPPARVWYQSVGRQIMRDEYFPDLWQMEKDGYEYAILNHYVISTILPAVMPFVKEDDCRYVWKQVIKPDYEKNYKYENNYEQSV